MLVLGFRQHLQSPPLPFCQDIKSLPGSVINLLDVRNWSTASIGQHAASQQRLNPEWSHRATDPPTVNSFGDFLGQFRSLVSLFVATGEEDGGSWEAQPPVCLGPRHTRPQQSSLDDRSTQPRPKILSRVQGGRATRAAVSSVVPFCYILRIQPRALRLEQLPELEILESLRPSPFPVTQDLGLATCVPGSLLRRSLRLFRHWQLVCRSEEARRATFDVPGQFSLTSVGVKLRCRSV